jgi:hypothetical protein
MERCIEELTGTVLIGTDYKPKKTPIGKPCRRRRDIGLQRRAFRRVKVYFM